MTASGGGDRALGLSSNRVQQTGDSTSVQIQLQVAQLIKTCVDLTRSLARGPCRMCPSSLTDTELECALGQTGNDYRLSAGVSFAVKAVVCGCKHV